MIVRKRLVRLVPRFAKYVEIPNQHNILRFTIGKILASLIAGGEQL
jgi:hypothetical protein